MKSLRMKLLNAIIDRLFFNYEKPIYYRYLYDRARQYVNFYQGDQNGNMRTNGEFRFLHALMAHGGVNAVFDVGANVGEYSKFLLSQKRDLHLHIFEPGKMAFGKLKSDLSQCHLNNVAVSDKSGRQKFFVNRKCSELNSFYMMPENGGDEVTAEEVDTITLDQYCRDKNIKHIDLLKIDVEGHELMVLHGASELLSTKRIDVIQFEFGYAAIYARTYFKDILDLFSKYGYDVYKIKPLNLKKVVYGPEMENIPYANFVALRNGSPFEEVAVK